VFTSGGGGARVSKFFEGFSLKEERLFQQVLSSKEFSEEGESKSFGSMLGSKFKRRKDRERFYGLKKS